MVNQDLISYVQQSLRSGYTTNQIRQSLQQSGYDLNDIEQAISQVQGSSRQLQAKLGFFTKSRLVLFRPKTFFERVKDESDLIHAFNFYLIWTSVFMIPFIVIGIIYFSKIISSNTAFSLLSMLLSKGALAAIIVLYVLFILYNLFLMPFKPAAYFFIALKWLFKIKTPFTQSYKAFVYPFLQVYVFPVVVIIVLFILGLIFGFLGITDKAGTAVIIIYAVSSILFLIYYIYTLTTGLAILNETTRLKAFIIVIIPLIIVIALTIILVLNVMSATQNLGGMLTQSLIPPAA